MDYFKSEGYCIIRNVFPKDFIDSYLLYYKSNEPLRRARSALQIWQGAIPRLELGTQNNVLTGDITSRGTRRFDLTLPADIQTTIKQLFNDNEITALVSSIVKNGRYQAMNIIQSVPGAPAQNMHTDSDWEKDPPKPGTRSYVTILIPLSHQTFEMGGTRIWPGTHLKQTAIDESKGYIDFYAPLVARGDAIIFDGHLAHLGLANQSKENRYIFYASFAYKPDGNI